MCAPPDGNPSLQCIGNTRGVNASKYTVDQRPFVWLVATKPDEKPPSQALWKPWTTSFYPGGTLPCAGIQTKAGGSDEPFEADSSFSFGSRLRAPETSTDPKEIEILQYKIWELQKDGQEAAAAPAKPTPSFLASPFCAASDRTSISKNGSVVSSTSSPTISMPVDSDSIEAPHPIDPWESSRSKEEMSRNSTCVKDLIEDGRIKHPAAMKRKLSSFLGKTSTISHHKERHFNNRHAVSKKENFTSNKDVHMSITVADIEDPSDDEDEGSPGLSEKRRKRMLSNRASAQRSRQRRQERLDTLEVLVAELRVENAALTRRANYAAMAAKKLEEENITLRDRLSKQEPVPLSDSNASNESDKTTEDSNVEVNNKIGSSWRPDIGPPRSDLCNHLKSCPEKSLSRANSGALKKERGDETLKNSRHWIHNFTTGSSDFPFNSDLMESATYREFNRTEPPENSGGANVKDLYQSEITSLAQNQSSQGRDPFVLDFEHCYLEMENSEFDSRSVEDIWLESLAKCLK